MAAFETQTNRITAVAIHLTSETAVPTLPAAGANMDWAALPDGWAKIGFKFADDAFAPSKGDQKRLEVWPPGEPMKTRVIELPEAIGSVDFTAYEIGGIVYGYATNYTETNGVYEPDPLGHTVHRALIIEYGGVGLEYFPKVTISVESPAGAIWVLGTQKGKIEVLGTTTIPSGHQWHQYA